MTEINRRGLIGAAGAAGATVALAACGGKGNKNNASVAATDSNNNGNKGINDQWGDDPHRPAPSPVPTGGFNPTHICIVYIRFEGSNNKSVVRHGYIAIRPRNAGENDTSYDAYQLTQATLMFKQASTGNWNENTPTGERRKRVNFEDFSFGHQMRIFVLIDNDNIKFDDRKIDQEYANLIRFTAYRTTDSMTQLKPVLAKENNSFYGATLVDVALPGRARKTLRFDNWYIAPPGVVIEYSDPSTHQLYAMNFQLLWLANEKGTRITHIPMIIDPDGGNMGSQP